ncbi:DUF3035 domain-containing protein [Rhodobacteraceae bacterium NNCM2]|nr:DUF3035 domain-containing protein [Coraliihabitans acroporae]
MGLSRLNRCAIMIGALVTVAGCESLGNPFQAFASKKPTPDEFAVVARAPLVMPTNDALPEPTPGTPSPLDPDPQKNAIEALAGTSQTVPSSTQISQSEEVLLSSANAAAATSEIRYQLEQDKIKEEEEKPYEPPLITELIFGTSEEEKLDKETLLDPNAESRRLQESGQITPVNPFEKPPEDETAQREVVKPEYDSSTDRRPNNKLYETEPKF